MGLRSKPARLTRQTSAGGVVYKRESDSTSVALISVRNGQILTIPKGIVDAGETVEQTAIREVNEETGLMGNIIKELGTVSYWYFVKDENKKCRKTVHYYLMEYVTGDTKDHDMEVDGAHWFDINDAIKKVIYRGDREILKKVKEIVNSLIPPKPLIKGRAFVMPGEELNQSE